MSQPELIDAYKSGRIGRRAFVRGMVGLGLSVSVATAMADRVRAQSATPAATPVDDTYDPVLPPVTTLPSTGAAESSTSMGTAAKAIGLAAAGAAVVSSLLRRKSKEANETSN